MFVSTQSILWEDNMIKKNQKGFTLIELLIVIAIIAILAAIAIPQFSAYRSRAVRASMVADARNVATAAEALFQDQNTYANLVGGGPGPGAFDIDGTGTTSNVNLSKGNTLAFTVFTAAAWTLTITNAAGDGGGFTGPLTSTSAGTCSWASLQNC
jgi:prepilin-type N-terminal cleavage/methylation domain-containing protein